MINFRQFRDLIPVSGRRYRKSLEIMHSLQKAYEEAKGERALAQRSLHHAMGDLAKKMSTWIATEHDETLDIGLRTNKSMAKAALKESPAEFKRYLAEELAARAVGALQEMVDEIDAQKQALDSHRPSAIIRN